MKLRQKRQRIKKGELKPNITFDLAPAIIPLKNETIYLNYNFVFGDRRNHIDCQHSDSSDNYFLEMSFTLTNPGDAGYALTDFERNEIFAAGHL